MSSLKNRTKSEFSSMLESTVRASESSRAQRRPCCFPAAADLQSSMKRRISLGSDDEGGDDTKSLPGSRTRIPIDLLIFELVKFSIGEVSPQDGRRSWVAQPG